MNTGASTPDPDCDGGVGDGAARPESYFALYSLAVEMADRVSARRAVANSFFLTVNTGVVAILGDQNVRWYLPIAGIVFSVTWWAILKSYRDLNAAKFAVILAMEERLPSRIFGDEWQQLQPHERVVSRRRPRLTTWLSNYRELGRVERFVPWVFALIYIAEILRQAVR